MGDFFNMVPVVEREKGCSRAEAVSAMVQDLQHHVHTLMTAEAALLAALEPAGVSLADRSRAYTVVGHMRSGCDASYVFCRDSARYVGAPAWASFHPDLDLSLPGGVGS